MNPLTSDGLWTVAASSSAAYKTRIIVNRPINASDFNGTVLVELAPLRDPAVVVQTMARALDIAIDPAEEPLAALAAALAPQELLLVVDNAEHVRTAAPAFAELVARAPRLTRLARQATHEPGVRAADPHRTCSRLRRTTGHR